MERSNLAMIEGVPDEEQRIPRRTLGVSLATLLIPVLGTLLLPERLADFSATLWLLALVPTFVLAFHRGWKGAAAAVGIVTGVFGVTLALAMLGARPSSSLSGWTYLAYFAISAGIGRLSHLLHRQNADVQDLALTDNLTGLPNRRHAQTFLEREFAAAKRGHVLSVVMFDLDGFKAFNDLHGHRAGDRALKRFGEILASTTRRMNLSCRFGGEEFLSILSGSDEAGSLVFANRVRESLESVRLSQGSLTVSGGVAVYHPSMRSPEELIAAADLALYRAKRDGRNCIRVFGLPEGESDTGAETAEGEAATPPKPVGDSDIADVAETIRPELIEAARSIARAVEIRDSGKVGHGSRVARYAEVIARVAGMIPSDLNADTLRLACELYDIGEVGVPRAVLTKKAPLTREELLQVQRHPLIGHRILEPLVSEEGVLMVAKSHHERWDGSGYPDGLAGDRIPSIARLVSIADALDAMTKPRAYRAALPWLTAVEQISGLGGSQFDPVLIDWFRLALPELEALAKEGPERKGASEEK